MTLDQFITSKLKDLHLTRGDLPQLLGYVNGNKCLRIIDRLLKGDVNQHHLLMKIRESPLGGDEFESVLREQIRLWDLQRNERQRERDLKEKLSFVPHLHFIHERNVPSPIHVVCIIGVHHFKRLDIPQHILDFENRLTQLTLVEEFILEYLRDSPDRRLVSSPFGRVIQILFRDEYEHSYVFDVERGEFVDSLSGVPRVGEGRLSVRGGGELR